MPLGSATGEALLANRRFLQAYRDAWTALNTGMRDVVFPCGTYWLRRFAEVKSEHSPEELAA